MTTEQTSPMEAEPPAPRTFERRPHPRVRISHKELFWILAILALDFYWFRGWLAIALALVAALAVHHVAQRPLSLYEVALAIVTVAVVDECYWYLHEALIGYWDWYDQYVRDSAWLTLCFVGGLMYSTLPVPPAQRSIQLVATALLTALIVRLLQGLSSHYRHLPGILFLSLALICLVLLVRDWARYGVHLWPPSQVRQTPLERAKRILVAACLIIVFWVMPRMMYVRRVH